MDPWRTPVDRAKALRLISPLPDGTVAGVQQVARRGDMTVTAILTQTIRQDTWSGIQVSILSPSAGAVASNWFGFAEHGTFDESRYPRDVRDGELDRLNQQAYRLRPDRLRDAVEDYTAAFALPCAPQFAAAARLGALSAMARRLDHVRSTHSAVLAGRAFEHAEVLREVAQEIHASLLPLTGEWKAADSAPFSLPAGLSALRRLRDVLTCVADRADEAGRGEGTAFRLHAKDLDDIDTEITADLAGPRAADGTRAAAATSSSPASSSTPAPDRPAASPAPTQVRGSGHRPAGRR
ncbi:hypothetical protein HUT16_17475 [Kitasatospora sp. NA04385]|uniref:hypothetical protein n=1 Tax=Kitasatospora sp. NA04385 TaxID=2742135 RepID=UPI001591F960|nr:hypothetical protein [Kitasatospora sp. NA04385]QKW20623.1 hypothetical protein HUT16_17475 [Kitasatospora sp. NA04385]